MKSVFVIDKLAATVREIPRTPENEKLYKCYETRKEALRKLFLQLCDEADLIIGKKNRVYLELVEIVTKEGK